jgi:glycosyltransferase involved in cell wall biosynthesis
MACGKPIIAFKEAELEALLLKSEGGFCVSSLEEMESLILRLADCADLARSIGANARRYVELNHDLTLLTRLTVELIRGVVSSKQTQSRRNRACVV